MFNIDDKEIKHFEKILSDINETAFPKVVRSTLERTAYITKKQYDENVRKELVIRGNKTKNIVMASIGYTKSPNTLDINKMVTYVGQYDSKYGRKTEQLRIQEFGENIISETKYSVKPTKTARSGKYTNIVNRKNYLAGMEIKRTDDLTNKPAKDIKNQFAQAVAIAHRTKPRNKYIYFLPNNNSNKDKKFGVFQLVNNGSYIDENGKQRAKMGSVKFLYAFKDRTQALDARPMLKPAVEKIINKSGKFFKHEAERRINKELSKLEH